MNPLDFFFNGQSGSQAAPFFAPVTQGVSTFSSGVNPAALEAQVDFGGTLMQYNAINSLNVGGLQGLFQTIGNIVGTILQYAQLAAEIYAGG